MSKKDPKKISRTAASQKKHQMESGALEARGGALSLTAEIFALILLAVYPLYLNSDRYIALVKHKTNFLWMTSLILTVALALVALAFLGIAKSHDKTRPVLYAADWAAVAYLACIILSCVTSPLTSDKLGAGRFEYFMWGNANPSNPRLEGLVTWSCYLLAYFAVSRLFRPRERDWAIFAVSANLLALIGFFQFIGHDFLDLYPYEREGMAYPYGWIDIHFRSTLGNVDVLSAYVGIVIPFFMVLYCKGAGKLRFIYLSAVVTNFMLMILGGADGGKVGVLAALTAVFVLVLTDRTALTRFASALGLSSLSCLLITAAQDAREVYNSTGFLHRMTWGGHMLSSVWFLAGLAGLAIAAVIRFAPIPFNPKAYRLAGLIASAVIVVGGVAGLEIVGARAGSDQSVVYQARQVMHGRMEDHYGSGRGFVWRRTMTVIAERPLLGTGPDTFYNAFWSFQREAMDVTGTPFDKAHNDLLEIAVCSGLLGLAAYLALLGGVASRAVSKLQKSPWMLAASVAAFGFFVQSLFGVSVPLVTPLFYVMLGTIISLSKNGVKSAQS
ncbi:MAG: O-antigen ligase family protein [Oscillospiraceae bacterium]|nr:O-antigen ligase family protein [Oscillospiraceae bacterium]